MNLPRLSAFPRYSYLTALIILCVFAAFWTGKEHWSGDFFSHAAVVKELRDNPLHPIHPIIVSEKPHPFFSPYAILVALLAKFAGISAISALGIAGLLNCILFLGCFYYFSVFFFQTNRSLCVAFSLLLVLFFWGEEPYFWSGFSHFIAFWSTLPYPSTFSLSLFFLLMGLLLRTQQPGIFFASGVMITSCAILLIHPNTWVCMVPLFFGIRYYIHGISFGRSLASATLVTVVSIGLTWFWPYYSFYDLVLHPDPQYHQHSLALYEHPLRILWPLLFSIPAFFLVERNNQSKLLAFGCLILLAVYGLGWVTKSYGIGRTISMSMVLGQLLVVNSLHRADFSTSRTKMFFGATCLALLVCFYLNYWPMREQARHAFTAKQTDYYTRYAFLSRFAKSSDCIMAPEYVVNIIPAFGIRVVGNRSPLYWIPDAIERRNAVVDFYENGASIENRSLLLKKYNCRFFMTTADSGAVLKDAYSLGTLVYDSADVKLFECRGRSVNM